ncbi:hypothetical protein IWQ61_008440 [Dispira simplex]|nr:hypothetical protein IWQ61_008440 [Dispira simplex]
MQGIFSFAIFLLHPVMLSTYRTNNIGITSVWTKVTRRLHPTGSSSTGSSASTLQGGSSHRKDSQSIGDTNVTMANSALSHLKTLDMGPGVTNLFHATDKDNPTDTFTLQNIKSGFASLEICGTQDGDLENQTLLSEFDDPTCL